MRVGITRARYFLATCALIACCATAPDARASITAGHGFIENQGQWPGEVLYSADLGSIMVHALDDGLLIDLAFCGTAVRLALPPSSLSTVVAREPDQTRWHYFLGDPSCWRTEVRGYRELIWPGAAGGAGLRIRPGRDELLFELDGPGEGARPREVMRYIGVDGISEGANGRRRITCPGATLLEIPLASDGSRWSLRLSPESPGPPPPAREEPEVLAWSTYLGGAHNDYSQAIELDRLGRPVLTGYTNSGAFPTTPGAYDRTHAGSYDVFVAKLASDGSTLLWGTYVGGLMEDRAFDLALDSSDRVVVVGHTFSSDFPTTPSAFDRLLGGSKDAFAFELSAEGNSLVWSTFLGGSGSERAHWVRVDSAGCPVFAGDTGSAEFPVTADAFDSSLGGFQDGYVVHLAASGNAILYSTYLGGSGLDSVNGVALDSAGRVLVTGTTTSADFPLSAGAYDTTPGGGDDAFVTLLDLAGAGLCASTFLGGSGDDVGFGVLVDAEGRVHMAGGTQSPDFPTTPAAHDPSWNGSDDAFYVCLDPSLTGLFAATFLGGTGSEFAFALALDPTGSPILTGETYSPGFPTTVDAFDRIHGGERDVFVTKLDPDRASLLWSSFLGGSDYDAGWDLEVLGPARVLVTGPTRSLDFPTTAGAYDRTYNGDQQDVFLAQLDWAPVSGVEPAPDAFAPLALWPNPFRESIALRVWSDGGPIAALQAFDVHGRPVARLLGGRLSRGEHWVHWDGTGSDRRPLPAGVYWLRWQSGSTTTFSRVVRLR